MKRAHSDQFFSHLIILIEKNSSELLSQTEAVGKIDFDSASGMIDKNLHKYYYYQYYTLLEVQSCE